MKRILSIDGGGIRGIIPGMVVVSLDERIKRFTNNPDAHIADYFEFFAGTSTGGLLIALLLCPDAENSNRPKYTAKQALNIYLEHGTEIFTTSSWRRFLNQFGLLAELYDEKVLEKTVNDYVGDIKLSQLIKPCLMTAYNIELRKNHLFRQQKAISHGPSRDYLVRDVCRATTAAPTYFSVAQIFSLAGTRYPLVDGGVFAHNPSICALIEVLKTFQTFKIDDVHILSLGTGLAKNAYNYDDFKKKKAISIGPALVDIMSSGSSESNDFFLRQLFRSIHKSNNYIRLEPTNLSSIEPSLDAASKTNIQKLVSLADKLISENEDLLDALARDLIADKENTEKKEEKEGYSVWKFLKDKL